MPHLRSFDCFFIESNAHLRERGRLSTSKPKSQIPIIDQAIESAAPMFGTDKSRGWLGMICGPFRQEPTPVTRCKRFFAANTPRGTYCVKIRCAPRWSATSIMIMSKLEFGGEGVAPGE
jgi:hypothetical protein